MSNLQISHSRKDKAQAVISLGPALPDHRPGLSAHAVVCSIPSLNHWQSKLRSVGLAPPCDTIMANIAIYVNFYF